jgi:hypothetical protein
VVKREGPGHRSDCTLRLNSGISLHAEGQAQEPYLCFDLAAAKIGSRLGRNKTRLKSYTIASTAHAPGKVANYLIEQPAEEEEKPARGFNPVVVADETGDLKSLSVASARHRTRSHRRSSRRVSACRQRPGDFYRRRDGAIGWLDPQPLANRRAPHNQDQHVVIATP